MRVGAVFFVGAATATVTLDVSPSSAMGWTVPFTVKWAGVPSPQSTDWVAAYCHQTPVSEQLAWTYVTASSTWASGRGNASFTITFNHCDIEFRLYRDPSPYILLGVSNVIDWPAPDGSLPRQVHIAYGTRPQTEITISWTSDNPVDPAVVLVGTQSGKYDLPSVVARPALTYMKNDSCGTPDQWVFPGYFHHATITNLMPNTRYFVLPTQNKTQGNETSFVTGKEVGAEVPARFAVYCDMGTWTVGALETAEHMTRRLQDSPAVDFVLHVGDIAYGEGDVNVWSYFMDLIEPYAQRLPYHVSIGNHEYDYPASDDGKKDPSGAGKMYNPSWWNGDNDSGGECGLPTARRFLMPENGNGVFWYSFAVSNVFVVMVSSEHDPSPSAPMGLWLEKTLASVDRSVTPWLLLGIHRPLVETEAYPSDFRVAAGLRAILEPTLLKWKVDIVLAGHYHSFQRTCPMVNLTCVKGGIVHYTTGAAGADLDDVSVYPSTYIEKTILGKFGYSILNAVNSSALSLTFFADDSDQVADEVWVYR